MTASTDSNRETKRLEGSCACGVVQYEIDGPLLGPVTYCHCWRCRKHSGSSFGTTVGLRTDDFRILTGADRISSWESSEGVHRYFSACCGSPIFKKDDASVALIGFRLGTLDSDPGVTVSLHYMIESKAPWVVIEDSLPQRSGAGCEFGQRD